MKKSRKKERLLYTIYYSLVVWLLFSIRRNMHLPILAPLYRHFVIVLCIIRPRNLVARQLKQPVPLVAIQTVAHKIAREVDVLVDALLRGDDAARGPGQEERLEQRGVGDGWVGCPERGEEPCFGAVGTGCFSWGDGCLFPFGVGGG